VRKTLIPLLLGAALLAPCGTVFAGTPVPVEPRWGIRPERSGPALSDLARWLSERFGRIVLPAETDPEPAIDPVPGPVPGPSLDVVCPERQHCPMG
jgi:hypothetical protein